MDNKESFTYTYSAAQQEEIAHIRKKYLPKEDNKMEQLRKLDALPHQKAQTAALTVGILGSLIMGTGMSLLMTELGTALGSLAMLFGVIIGLVGMIMVALAYPVYNKVLKKERARIAPQILQLTDELIQN